MTIKTSLRDCILYRLHDVIRRRRAARTIKGYDFPTTGYEAAEEERHSLEQEQDEEQIMSQQLAHRQRGEGRRTRRSIGAAASGRQIMLFDLDKQLNKQRTLMQRMADDIKHLRKQFNQVQRDLTKFEKRFSKTTKATTRASEFIDQSNQSKASSNKKVEHNNRRFL